GSRCSVRSRAVARRSRLSAVHLDVEHGGRARCGRCQGYVPDRQPLHRSGVLTMKNIVVAAALLLATTTAHAEVKRGEHFVELEAKAGNGKAFRLKDMAGKWVLFGFNASWCGPCKKELPALD